MTGALRYAASRTTSHDISRLRPPAGVRPCCGRGAGAAECLKQALRSGTSRLFMRWAGIVPSLARAAPGAPALQ
jgi:hypothetical protein